MSSRLQGRTALVTGAAQGIGLAIGRAFLAEGATLIASDVAADRLAAAYAGTSARLTVLDVTDEVAVNEAAVMHSEVDVLVNCAGWVANGTILETTAQDFNRSWNLNVLAMATTIRAFLPAMQAGRRGSIINIASVVSSVKAAPNRCAYATTPARWTAPAWPIALPPLVMPKRPAPLSWRGSRWDASARRRKLPPSPCCLPATRQPS